MGRKGKQRSLAPLKGGRRKISKQEHKELRDAHRQQQREKHVHSTERRAAIKAEKELKRTALALEKEPESKLKKEQEAELKARRDSHATRNCVAEDDGRTVDDNVESHSKFMRDKRMEIDVKEHAELNDDLWDANNEISNSEKVVDRPNKANDKVCRANRCHWENDSHCAASLHHIEKLHDKANEQH